MADTIIGRIRAVITGDSKGLTVATEKAERSLKDLGNQAKKTSRETSTAMNSMAGTIGTAFATAKVLQFAKSSVLAAGDIAEAVNATRVIFGNASSTIEKFASTASKTLGQSEKQALDASNTFATFGKSAGLAGTDLSNFAMKMVSLSSDLASFRNTTPEDAIQAVGAALRGETEPIRRYGILLNDMTLRQEALRLGLVKTTSEALTPQAKVLAAQAAIWKQSTDAQGDFARTSGSLSNQIKIVNAQFEDMKARVGEAFVPLAQGALQVLNPLLKAFNALDGGTQKFIGQIVMLNAALVLAKRTLVGFGYEAKRLTTAMVGINAAFIGIFAVSKIFQAGVESNTAEVKDFTAALKENDSALRANALRELAEEDPKVREYLNTIGQIGLTVADLARYYQDLGGPAAQVRDGLSQIANSAYTSKDRLALLNKEFGLNIDVQGMTQEQADATYSRFQNLQFLLFNVEQEWRSNTLATDALATALTGIPTTADQAADALGYAAESLEKYKEAILGTANITKRELTVAINDTISSSNDFVEAMSEGQVANGEFVNGLIKQADSLLALQYATKGETKALQQVTPAMRFVIESMYRAGQAQGYTRQETTALINELGLLDGIDPQIRIFMSMDVEQLKVQAAAIRKQIESLRMDAFSRNSPVTRDLISQLEMIASIGDALNNVGDFKPSGGGGGGGGDKPFDWVKDWVKDLADFTEKVLDKDFSRQLIASSADEIADALSDLVKEATEKGISLLDGGNAVKLIEKVSLQLQAAANQLGGDNGLEARFKAATDKVENFEKALADLQARFREFQLSEQGIGSFTTLERLDIEIAKLEDLKGQLQSAQQAYADFKNAGTSALDAQLSRLDQLRSNLESLERGYEALNASVLGDAALSPLERETKDLEKLKSALDNASKARADYATSIEQQVSAVQFADQGGILGQARRYLAKASSFRDIIQNLRDRAFPTAIIRDVLAAGIDGGSKLGRKLLSLSDADLQELKNVQQQIGAVAAETGEVAASVLFDADVSAAQNAFNRQLGLVQNLYQQAIAQARNEFTTQQTIVEGVYQQQIAAAQAAVEQQKTVIEALFRTALAEAQGELEKARSTAQVLKTAIDDLRATMTSLISTIAQAVKDAQAAASQQQQNQQQQNQQPAQGGTTTAPAPGGATIPGTNIPIQVGTGDTGVPAPGQKVGGPDRIWGGPGGGAVVDGIFLPPGLFGKALGGPVNNQQSYLVGERGPEIFTPSRNGMIIPNDALVGGGGASTYNITVNARGDAGDIGRQVVKAIQEYERRNGTGWRS